MPQFLQQSIYLVMTSGSGEGQRRGAQVAARQVWPALMQACADALQRMRGTGRAWQQP